MTELACRMGEGTSLQVVPLKCRSVSVPTAQTSLLASAETDKRVLVPAAPTPRWRCGHDAPGCAVPVFDQGAPAGGPHGPDVVRRDGRDSPEAVSLDQRAGDLTPGCAVPVFDQLFSEVWVIRSNLNPDSPDVVAGRSSYAVELPSRGIYPSAGQGGGGTTLQLVPLKCSASGVSNAGGAVCTSS